MKNEELMAILNNAELSIEEKSREIQKLNGLDRTNDAEKHEKEIANMKADFEKEKTTWEEEKAKFDGYVSKDEHDKVMNELSAYQERETKGKQDAFLKSLGVLEGYEEFLGSKFDWSKLTYDETSKTYSGEGLDDFVKGLKEKTPLMFNDGVQPTTPKNVRTMGNYPSQSESLDLTKL